MAENLSSKTLSGARLKVGILDGADVKWVGIFTTVSWGNTMDAQPLYVLGAFAPVEIIYTAAEAVRVTASGFRIVGQGAHKATNMPYIQNLLDSQYLTLVIYDRQTTQTIATISDVRVLSYDTTSTARNPQEMTVTFMGRIVSDESGANSEGQGASVLP